MRRVIIILFVLAIVGAGAYWYITHKTTTTAPISTTGSFFPTGETRTPTGALPDTTEITNEQTPTPTATTPSRFTQISARAVAAYTQYVDTYKMPVPATDPKKKPTLIDVKDNVIRYISRATGYVYEKRNNEGLIQISNIYIPNIYEGYFADANNSAILRFLREDNRTIATYVVPVPAKNPDGTRTQAQGSFLPDGIESFVVSPDETEIGRVFTSANQGIIVTSDTKNKNQKELLRSSFTEWLPQWKNKNTLYLQTKAAASAEGFLYKIDRTERKLRRVIGNVPGLTTSVSPSGTYVLYSESTTTSFNTKLFNTKNNTTKTLSLKILPEKCTWLKNEDLICAGNTEVPSGTYPDNWYAGLTSFSDKVFRIYTANTTFDVVYDGTQGSYDMTNLSEDETRGLLYFIDKNTGLLWQLAL